jgi:hypothetical protein
MVRGFIRSSPHHAASQSGGDHHLIAGLEEDLYQSNGRLVPDHRPAWRHVSVAADATVRHH